MIHANSPKSFLNSTWQRERDFLSNCAKISLALEKRLEEIGFCGILRALNQRSRKSSVSKNSREGVVHGLRQWCYEFIEIFLGIRKLLFLIKKNIRRFSF